MGLAVLWFRRDLRLDDLPALEVARATAGAGGTVLPLFVVDPDVLGPVGPNRRHFLAGSLNELKRSTGGALVLRHGRPRQVVPAVAAAAGATSVVVTADFGPYGAARDRAVAEALAPSGIVLHAVSSPYAVDPGRVRAASGAPLKVFTAYHRAWQQIGWGAPVHNVMPRWASMPSDARIEDVTEGVTKPGYWGLPEWWDGLPLERANSLPPPGARAGARRLASFKDVALGGYARSRDMLGLDGTSKLSPYLHFGCLHPRTVLESVGTGPGAERLRSEVAWRDFYADVLWHHPASARQSLQLFGEHLRWDAGARARDRFRAWALGRTGYPLVDAAMRQLLAEGWVHNRARMVAASFLVKDLHLDWRLGARWFMWHLVDGDLASNQHGWQWVAGTGTDAAPFYRVFNPNTQAQRFDPDGAYVRRYVPELGGADAGHGQPGTVSAAYPQPVVDHARERQEALARFRQAREAAARVRDGGPGLAK